MEAIRRFVPRLSRRKQRTGAQAEVRQEIGDKSAELPQQDEYVDAGDEVPVRIPQMTEVAEALDTRLTSAEEASSADEVEAERQQALTETWRLRDLTRESPMPPGAVRMTVDGESSGAETRFRWALQANEGAAEDADNPDLAAALQRLSGRRGSDRIAAFDELTERIAKLDGPHPESETRPRLNVEHLTALFDNPGIPVAIWQRASSTGKQLSTAQGRLLDQPLGPEEAEAVAPTAEETIEHTMARMFMRLGPPPEPTELDYTPAGSGGGGAQQ